MPARVAVSGKSFGIKMYTEGVLVVGLAPVQSKSAEVTPASDAGIKVGDIIKKINGKKITASKQVSELCESSGGKALTINLTREEKNLTVKVSPIMSVSTKTYKIGLWVRDSTAGIGTITYFDTSGNFAALGHGINDIDTNELMPLGDGEAVDSKIIGLTKSERGITGELYGVFTDNAIGRIKINNDCGLYGTVYEKDASLKFIECAKTQDIKTGKATILTTIDGTGVHEYEIEITRINKFSNGSKDMVVKITDPKLLEATGGIVQGMSGSPIIQNGKFVGAITRVFVNKPSKGYAINAENMVKYTNSLKH